MSIYNAGGLVSSELGAFVTSALGVTDTVTLIHSFYIHSINILIYHLSRYNPFILFFFTQEFSNLPALITVCSLSSLVTLPFINTLDAVNTEEMQSTKTLK